MQSKEEAILTRVETGELVIDSEGRVWRVKRRMGGKGIRPLELRACQRKRAEYRDNVGYLFLAAMIDGKHIQAKAHRVVWIAFNGPIPEGLTINHKNGIKSDNRLENLELATMSEQRNHAIHVLHVRRNHPKGSKHPKTHLVEDDVRRMREMRRCGKMVKDIAAEFGMTKKATSAILCRRTWTHI